jgi:hypothetical protein
MSDLTDALRKIEALLRVSPEHRDRMQRWEHSDFNDTDNTAALAGTDRTILIGQMDAAATAVEEVRHSPHLWAEPRVDSDLAASIDAVADALNAWDQGEPPRPDTHRHWSKIVAALAESPTETPGLRAAGYVYRDIRNVIGFLRSCVRSGEQLNPTDEAYIDAALDAVRDLEAAALGESVSPEPGTGLRVEGLDLDELHAAISTADYWDPGWLDRYKIEHPSKYAATDGKPIDAGDESR